MTDMQALFNSYLENKEISSISLIKDNGDTAAVIIPSKIRHKEDLVVAYDEATRSYCLACNGIYILNFKTFQKNY